MILAILMAIVLFCIVVYPIGWALYDAIKWLFDWQGRYR